MNEELLGVETLSELKVLCSWNLSRVERKIESKIRESQGKVESNNNQCGRLRTKFLISPKNIRLRRDFTIVSPKWLTL